MSLFHDNVFWKINQFAVIAVWIVLIYANLDRPSQIHRNLLLLFFASHVLQFLLICRRMKRMENFSLGQIAVLTLLLGYSWWMPPFFDKTRNLRSRS